MPRLFVPIALVLALASGIVLNETRLIALAPVEVTDTSAAASPHGIVVRHLYDAINAVLAGGDPANVRKLVAPDFVDNVPHPGVAPDREGLIDYVTRLRTATPGLRLAVDRLFAQEDRIVAQVETEDAVIPADGEISRGQERPWGTIDVFGIQDGRIAEHWGDAAGFSHTVPLLDVTIPTDVPASSFVEIDRQTLPPSSVWQPVASGPTVLMIESGTLSVELLSRTAGAAIARPGQAPEPLPPSQQVQLATGDAAALPPSASYRAIVGEPTPAVVLVLWAEPQPRAVFVGIADMAIGNQTALPCPPFTDGTPAAVAGGLGSDLPDGGIRVTVNRYALAPGAALASHRVELAEFAVVSSGTLDIATGRGLAWTRDEMGGALRGTAGTTVGPGGGVQVEDGATASYRSVGATPVEFLLVTIGQPEVDAEDTPMPAT
jgi:predicted SnoaL-like aldol condensation-catalyzing enzyme